ncbi:TetR/AcrR family transcriptional regulator [Amycolatopsis sp. NPDC021455]|uniref:TetR/AcrR family transcriptional regulator n=1 Tax=Amycolatopsis sp. NPDC021455 TaxID=3154901 RepID=UPI0033E45864
MGRRDELASRTRADLLSAAKRLFGERGYLDTKITDIAAAAGRAVGSFYTHFSDKEQILAVLRGELDAAAPHPADHDATREHVTACWTAMRTHRPTVIALVQSAVAAAPASGRFRRELTGWTAPLRRHLEDLRDRGEPLPGDPELLAAAVGAMLAGLNHALPADDGTLAETITNLVLHGLTGPSPA